MKILSKEATEDKFLNTINDNDEKPRATRIYKSATSLVFKEKQIKTIMRYHLRSTKMA